MENETLEELCNEWKVENYQSEKNSYVEKKTHFLHKPLWTAAKLRAIVKDLTYRQINDWDSKNLIYCSRRAGVKGWRMLSIADMIRLCIVSDLRKIGVAAPQIRTVLKRISTDSVRLADTKTGIVKSFRFLLLEHAIISCIVGVKMLLLVARNERTFLLDEYRAVLSHFYVEDTSSPIIILPFFSYVKQVFALLRKDKKLHTSRFWTFASLLEGLPTEKEMKILDIIRNKAFQKIELVKSDNEQFTVSGISHQQGIFSNKDVIEAIEKGLYQNITVIRKDGKKIGLVREEKMKI